MIRFLYNLLWPIGLLFFLPGYLLKMFRRGGYRQNFGQRLGFYECAVATELSRSNRIWLHAVSVGEVGVALKLAQKLRQPLPEQGFVLTTTTTTGYAFARSNAPDWMLVLYSPLDFWPIMRRAFSVVRPRLIVLIEAEIWPNMIALARRHHVPVVLANARLSARSERRMRAGRFFIGPFLRQLALIAVQSEADIARWANLDVSRDRIRCVGSVKFDPDSADSSPTAPSVSLGKFQVEPDVPVLIGGSTHPGEEEILADVLLALRSEFPRLILIVAPRHVERSNEIERTLQRKSISLVRRSATTSVQTAPDCLLIDSTGELREWYAGATVVFIGKTMTAHGGQNPAEAISAGKPVVFGPHMENFAELARALVESDGAIRVASAQELQAAVRDLLVAPAKREKIAQNARAVLALHRGATERTARLIVDLLSNRSL